MKTDPDTVAAVVEAYKAKVPLADISQRYNVSRPTIKRIRTAAGLNGRNSRNTAQLTREDAVAFASMLRQGVSAKRAAAKLRRASSTLYDACERFGIDVMEPEVNDWYARARLMRLD